MRPINERLARLKERRDPEGTSKNVWDIHVRELLNEKKADMAPLAPKMPDFSQFGQQGIKDIHSGVSGGVKVEKPKHTQKVNDKALKKTPRALREAMITLPTGQIANEVNDVEESPFAKGFKKAAMEVGFTAGQMLDLLKSAGPIDWLKGIGQQIGAQNVGLPIAEGMRDVGQNMGTGVTDRATIGAMNGGMAGGGVGGLLGAGLGGGIGYLTGEDDEHGGSTKGRNAFAGALAGGGLGGIAGAGLGAGAGALEKGQEATAAGMKPILEFLRQQQALAGQK